jgi:3-isopropylmalate dehydrogenase
MLLRWSLGEIAAADALDKAVEATITAGLRTPDLGGKATTEQVTAAVVASVSEEVTA